jgi:hypothetical protein
MSETLTALEDGLARVPRDRASGEATGEVQGTPALVIDGSVHRGPSDAETLMAAIAS